MNMNQRIRQIIKKDKKVFIILLVAPLVVPFLAHFVYGQIFVESIPFAIVDLDNSSLSRNISQGLENHPGLEISEYYASEKELEDAIMHKEVVGGVVFPSDFSEAMNSPMSAKAAVIVDGTNTVTSGNASGYASQVIGTFNAGIQMGYMQANGMSAAQAENTMSAFSYTERVAYEPFLSYICNVVYIAVPFVIQTYYLTAFLIPAYVEEKHYRINHSMTVAEEKERTKFLASRILLLSVFICITSYASFAVYAAMQDMPLRGRLFEYFILLFLFLMAISAAGLVITAFFNEKTIVYFIEFYFIISSVIVITSGAVWPEYMMPTGMGALIKSIWPFFHVAMPIKCVNLKGVGWEVIWPYAVQCLVYFGVWLPIGIYLFKRKIGIKKLKMQVSL